MNHIYRFINNEKYAFSFYFVRNSINMRKRNFLSESSDYLLEISNKNLFKSYI